MHKNICVDKRTDKSDPPFRRTRVRPASSSNTRVRYCPHTLHAHTCMHTHTRTHTLTHTHTRTHTRTQRPHHTVPSSHHGHPQLHAHAHTHTHTPSTHTHTHTLSRPNEARPYSNADKWDTHLVHACTHKCTCKHIFVTSPGTCSGRSSGGGAIKMTNEVSPDNPLVPRNHRRAYQY